MEITEWKTTSIHSEHNNKETTWKTSEYSSEHRVKMKREQCDKLRESREKSEAEETGRTQIEKKTD